MTSRGSKRTGWQKRAMVRHPATRGRRPTHMARLWCTCDERGCRRLPGECRVRSAIPGIPRRSVCDHGRRHPLRGHRADLRRSGDVLGGRGPGAAGAAVARGAADPARRRPGAAAVDGEPRRAGARPAAQAGGPRVRGQARQRHGADDPSGGGRPAGRRDRDRRRRVRPRRRAGRLHLVPRAAAATRTHRAVAHARAPRHEQAAHRGGGARRLVACYTKHADVRRRIGGAQVARFPRMLLSVLSILVGIAIGIGLTYTGRPWWGWLLGWIVPLARWHSVGGSWGLTLAILVWLGVAILTGVPAIRRRALTGPAMRRLAPLFPRMSETERIALEAGTVWGDGELFSGAPDWARMVRFAPQPLSGAERAFLARPRRGRWRLLGDPPH